MDRDELIRQLRQYGDTADLSDRTEKQLTNMVAGYVKKGQKVLYRDVCPYFLGVQRYDPYHWKIGCSRRIGCDVTPLDQKNWAATQARRCFQPEDAKIEGFALCRFFVEAKEESAMKQKYICKCGKTFEKQGESDTTGYRLGLDSYKSGHECFGCHFVVPLEEGYPNPKVVDYECRASKTINYQTTADLPRSRDGFHVGRIHTLDMDFARTIWEYSRDLPGLEDNSKAMDLRGACYAADGRYCLSLYFTKTKAGVQSCIEISDKFFGGGSARPEMTQEQEKQLVLQQIERSKSAAKSTGLSQTETNPSDLQNGRSIEQITLEINFYKAQTAQNIIEIGKRLLEAKQKLNHGEWLPWLREKVQFSIISAQRFMRIAQEFSNASPVTYLPYTKLIALLQVPESEREEFIQETHLVEGQEKTVADMSKRELEQVIKERDDARNESKQFQEKCMKAERMAADAKASQRKEYDNYMDALDKLEKSEKTAKTLRDSIQIKYLPQLQRVEELEKQVRNLESRPVDVAVREPTEEERRQFREEGALSVRQQYEKQLADAQRELEEAKSQTRREIGLEPDEITAAAASFRDSLDSLFDNFQLILRVSPANAIETVVTGCTEHMRGLIHDLEESAALIQNASLIDEDFELPPEDGETI